MITIPQTEQDKFEAILTRRAGQFGLTPEEYLRKVWYHEEASRLGEYIALVLLEQLLPLAPKPIPENEEIAVTEMP